MWWFSSGAQSACWLHTSPARNDDSTISPVIQYCTIAVCQLPLANLCPILHYPPQDRCYFDGERCMVFTYWGCEGNGNNFLTCDACESLCLGATSSTLSTQATAQPLSHQHTESTTLHYNHPDATGPADHTTTQQWTVQRLTTAAATVQEHTTGTQPESTVQNPTTRTLITTTETVEQSTEKRPGLNTYGYIVITIGIVLVLLVGVSVVLVVTVIWRVIRVRLLHTKIM